jgi:hypothetical protein
MTAATLKQTANPQATQKSEIHMAFPFLFCFALIVVQPAHNGPGRQSVPSNFSGKIIPKYL